MAANQAIAESIEQSFLRTLGEVVGRPAAEALCAAAARDLGLNRPIRGETDARRMIDRVIEFCGAARSASRMALLAVITDTALVSEISGARTAAHGRPARLLSPSPPR